MSRDLLASIIFSVICFLFFVFIVPQYQAILDVRGAIKDRQALLEERTTLKTNVVELATKYEARQAEIGRLALFLPAENQYDQIIESIYSIAAQSGLHVSTLSMDEESKTTTEDYSRIFIKIDTSASYEALNTLLSQLEKNLRLYDISEINIGRGTGGAAAGTYMIEIKFNTYRLK